MYVKTDLITEQIKKWQLDNETNVLDMPISKVLDIAKAINVTSKLVIDVLIAYDIVNPK